MSPPRRTAASAELWTDTTDDRGGWTAIVVRLLDVLIATVALVLTAPILLVAAVAIRAGSHGPVIFRQQRLGLHKRSFTVYKLRTMRAQADPNIHREFIQQLIAGAKLAHSKGRRTLYKLVEDDRVTTIGRVLRKTSIDELPQLVNVLRGHMSIVGPRPVIPYETEHYPPEYDRRFSVKPGLTGLWQVNGRNKRTYEEMIALDIAWVDRGSVALYLAIVARTPWVLLRSRDAS